MREVLEKYARSGPGLVALVARGDDVDVATAGLADLESGAPMTR